MLFVRRMFADRVVLSYVLWFRVRQGSLPFQRMRSEDGLDSILYFVSPYFELILLSS